MKRLFSAIFALIVSMAAISAATVEDVPNKWRRVNIRGDLDPNWACLPISRDGVGVICAINGKWGGYAHTLPGQLYEWTIGKERVLYRAPNWRMSPNTGNQAMNAAFFRFLGTPAPFTIEQAQGTLSEWTDQVAAESFNQLQLSSTARGWYVMPLPISDPFYDCDHQNTNPESVNFGLWVGCDVLKMRRDAEGVLRTLGQPIPHWFVFTDTATSGASWFIGATASNGFDKGIKVLMHEAGHHWGLKHASSCGTGPLVDAPSDYLCSDFFVSGYGDVYDWMGTRGRFSPLNRLKLGWLHPRRVRWIHSSGAYDLYESRHPIFRVVALRILYPDPDPNVKDIFYSLEYRADVGGVLVRINWGHPYATNLTESILLNSGRPLTAGGHVFEDRGISIWVEYADQELASVRVHKEGVE